MNSPGNQIRHEITEYGAIPFARFMELALYCPLCGYYEKKRDTMGQRGDFYTSVSVGPLFGELLAFQFAEWLEECPVADSPPSAVLLRRTGRLQIIEAGVHDGRLAKDILNWLRLRRPGLFERIEYWIVEPSVRRQEWQRETLREFALRARWFTDFRALAGDSVAAPGNPQSAIGNRQSVRRVIFSNELLDAMSVQRVGWDSKRRKWFEWGVTLDGDRFVWTRLGEQSGICNLQSEIRNAPRELLAVLPDGFTIEICPAAENWWREAAKVLKHGKLLTLDYGLSAEELFAPQRADGTLRAYNRHRVADDVLANPGEQDLTAHVNFTAIQRAGEAAGLRTDSMVSQGQFLTSIAQRVWQEGSGFGSWTAEHTRQFQTLTHPDHLGRSFRVLLQSLGKG